MRTHLTTKIERRAARAKRKAARHGSYGKRSAHVRPQNMANRKEYVWKAAQQDLATMRSGRPVAPERKTFATPAEDA